MLILFATAFFDKMLLSLGIQPAVKIPIADEGSRQRREYRGTDPKNPVLDPTLVYSWIATYDAEVAKNAALCASVQDKYEMRVQQYGYSLKNLRRVVPTKFLREFMLSSLESEVLTDVPVTTD